MHFHFTEPHPSHHSTSTAYIGHGRGGAGNIASYPSTSLTAGSTGTGPASLHAQRKASAASSSSSSSVATNSPNGHLFGAPISDRRVSIFAGRGGAGNWRSAPPTTYDFDEELGRQEKKRESIGGIVHVGRGGSGNAVMATEFGAGPGGKMRTASMVSTNTDGGDRRKSWLGLRGLLGRD